MRAIQLTEFGTPDVLKITELPTPTPSDEQLLIKVEAAALNRADLLQRRGKYPPPPGESNILGLEIAGTVVDKGKNATLFQQGDRVFGLVGSGGYAEYCVIDHETAMLIPDHLSFTDAAGIAEAFLTANEAIFTLGQLQPHETILIHAGASGVGTAAIQLAKQMNACIFTTVGSNEKIEKLRTFEIDHIINYKTTSFADEIHQIIPNKGIDVIIDFVGASYLKDHLSLLNPKGRLICVGLMGGTTTEIDLSFVQKRRLQIKGLVMRTQSLAEKRDIAKRFQSRWLPLFSEEKLHPVIDSIFPFEKVAEAHQHMENNANVGKIILKI